VTTDSQAQVVLTVIKGKDEEKMEYDLEMLIDVKGWKAIGNKLSAYPINEIQLIESELTKSPEKDGVEEIGEESEDQLDIGSTVDLTPKKDEDDQMKLF
jgi:topoisomerase-4 subunit A